jgi:SAM-dependent methyltransferase
MDISNITWMDDHTFKTRNYIFDCDMSNFRRHTTIDRIVLLKPKGFLSHYAEILREGSRNIFELGFFQCGMPLLLADTTPAKIVAVDRIPPNEAVKAHIAAAGYYEKVKLHAPVMQDDGAGIRRILDQEFGSTPIDLITDDCSHEYAPTRASFETTFGYLRPGGRYIIEDWGWAHWRNRSHSERFADRPTLTNLIFEIVMALASAPDVVARVDIPNGAMAIITRGPALPYKAKLDLSNTYLLGTRQFGLM